VVHSLYSLEDAALVCDMLAGEWVPSGCCLPDLSLHACHLDTKRWTHTPGWFPPSMLLTHLGQRLDMAPAPVQPNREHKPRLISCRCPLISPPAIQPSAVKEAVDAGTSLPTLWFSGQHCGTRCVPIECARWLGPQPAPNHLLHATAARQPAWAAWHSAQRQLQAGDPRVVPRWRMHRGTPAALNHACVVLPSLCAGTPCLQALPRSCRA